METKLSLGLNCGGDHEMPKQPLHQFGPYEVGPVLVVVVVDPFFKRKWVFSIHE